MDIMPEISQIEFAATDESSLQELADLMNYYVLNTTVTFHTEPLSSDDMREKVFFNDPKYLSLLIRLGEKTIGWCAISPWKKQQAYRHTAEVNIYLQPDQTSKGIGTLVIHKLEEIAKSRDINNLIAGICSENTASIRLFEKRGFRHCALFLRTGKKFGRVLDMVYLQKILTV